MRYYKIEITNAKTGAAIIPSSLGGMPLNSLYPGGGTNPAALNVEFDIPVGVYALPLGSALVKIWGLGLRDIGASANLNDALISVYGGMAKGLPLANPNQAGLLVKGQILQAFGNWIGTEQSIDLLIQPPTGDEESPKNLVINWRAGQSLASALDVSLLIAFPEAKREIGISDKLVLSHDETGVYKTLSEFSEMVFRLSQDIITDPEYLGVQIIYDGARITVSDGTKPPEPKTISFQDLIGQPTWIGPNTIQAKLALRGDLRLMDQIIMPKSLATTTQQALIRFQDQSTFSGKYLLTEMHHYGNYRQPDAASWNTTINMTPIPKT